MYKSDNQLIFEAYDSQPVMTKDKYGSTLYHLNGKKHREDGPAVEFPDGSKFWFNQDKQHRVGGPAIEFSNGNKEWWMNGQRHREDGPAIENKPDPFDDDEQDDDEPFDDDDETDEAMNYREYQAGENAVWWFNGDQYNSPERWAAAVLRSRNEPVDQQSIQNFLRPIIAKQTKDLI